jgi:hypothetical protein
MKLTPPKVVTFWISVILVVLGLIGRFGNVAGLAQYDFWLVFFGFVLLALSVLMKDL